MTARFIRDRANLNIWALDVILDLAQNAPNFPTDPELNGGTAEVRDRAVRDRAGQLSGTMLAIERVVQFARTKQRHGRRIRLTQVDRPLPDLLHGRQPSA